MWYNCRCLGTIYDAFCVFILPVKSGRFRGEGLTLVLRCQKICNTRLLDSSYAMLISTLLLGYVPKHNTVG